MIRILLSYLITFKVEKTLEQELSQQKRILCGLYKGGPKMNVFLNVIKCIVEKGHICPVNLEFLGQYLSDAHPLLMKDSNNQQKEEFSIFQAGIFTVGSLKPFSYIYILNIRIIY